MVSKAASICRQLWLQQQIPTCFLSFDNNIYSKKPELLEAILMDT